MAVTGDITGNNYDVKGYNLNSAEQVASSFTTPSPPRGSVINVHSVGLRVGGANGENGRVQPAIWNSAGTLVTNGSPTTVGGTSGASNMPYVDMGVGQATLSANTSYLIGFWRPDGDSAYTTSWSYNSSAASYSLWYDNAAPSLGSFDKSTTHDSTAQLCYRIYYYYTPATVTGLSLTRGNGAVSVSWNALASDSGTWGDAPSSLGYAGTYYVQYSTDDVNWTSRPATVGTSDYISGLSNGTKYYFRVVAKPFISTLTSVTASQSIVPYTTPAAPETVTSTPHNGYISVSYTAPTSDGGESIDYYQYSTDNSTWTGSLASPIGNPFSVSGTNGTALTVYVRAVNAAGGGASKSTTSTPRTVPESPRNLIGNNSVFGQISLSWDIPLSDGGNEIDGYKVRTGLIPGSGTIIYQGTTRSYTHTNLLPYTDYSYNVVAYNDAGDGTAITITVKTLGGLIRIMTSETTSTPVVPQVYKETSPGVFQWVDAQARIYTNTGTTEEDKWKYGT